MVLQPSGEESLKVLVLGAGGMLGSDLVSTAPPGVAITRGLDAARLDITDKPSIAHVLDTLKPATVINAAAYTKVDDAETNEERAFAVNSTAVGELGMACGMRGIKVVHFSTDYVFPGTSATSYREDDPVGPVNAYGRSKLAGEEALRASGAEMLIVRTQWLFGVNGRSFPRTMWERARARLATRVVADQYGRPTFTEDLAIATWRLIAVNARGTFHITNEGEATWFEVAQRVFEGEACTDLLSACGTDEYATRARRPRYSVLDTARFQAVAENRLPHWTDALNRFTNMLRTAVSSVGPSSGEYRAH